MTKILRWIISIFSLILSIIPFAAACFLSSEPDEDISSLAMAIAGISGLAFVVLVNPFLSSKIAKLQSTKVLWTGAVVTIFVGVVGLVIGLVGTNEMGKSDYQDKLVTYGIGHGGIFIKSTEYKYYEYCLYGGENSRGCRESARADNDSSSDQDIIPYIAWFVETARLHSIVDGLDAARWGNREGD